MKNKIRTLAVLFFVLIMSCGCEDAPPTPTVSVQNTQTQNVQASTQSAQESQDVISEDEKSVSWPYNLKNSENVKISDGVYTDADKIMANNFVVVYDDSGSMSGSKIEDARKAFREFVTNILPDGSNLGLVSLNSGYLEMESANSETKEKFSQTIENINANNGTPLTSAVAKAFFMLTSQSFIQSGCGNYTILVITDGAADDPYTLRDWVNYIIDNSPVKIYTIGFQIGENHTLNQPGRTTYKTADNLEELIDGMKGVLAEAQDFDMTFE